MPLSKETTKIDSFFPLVLRENITGDMREQIFQKDKPGEGIFPFYKNQKEKEWENSEYKNWEQDPLSKIICNFEDLSLLQKRLDSQKTENTPVDQNQLGAFPQPEQLHMISVFASEAPVPHQVNRQGTGLLILMSLLRFSQDSNSNPSQVDQPCFL